MLKKETRYDNYAYRIADLPAAAALIASGFEEGMLLSFNSTGEMVLSDGKSPAFMAMSSCRNGRNQFTGKTTTAVSVMFGCARVATSNYVTSETFTAGTPLYVATGGKVSTTKNDYLIGYAGGAPTSDGYLEVYLVPPTPVSTTTATPGSGD